MNSAAHNTPPVAVIIPFSSWNAWVAECVEQCSRLEGPNPEIWLLPDRPLSEETRNGLPNDRLTIHIRTTGALNPAAKRNVALRESSAEVFALIDSDAYPRHDWLAKGLPLLSGDVAIVAGPNLTPANDPLLRRCTGRVMESLLGFGAAYIRHRILPQRFVNEMPTCNMLIRRLPDLLFREELDTGEDMMYCADVRKRGFKVLYDPAVAVYHHRRTLGRAFFKQFYHYGLDKGRLSRQASGITYPWQAFPAMLLVYVLVWSMSWTAFLRPIWRWMLSLPLLLYALLVLVESARRC